VNDESDAGTGQAGWATPESGAVTVPAGPVPAGPVPAGPVPAAGPVSAAGPVPAGPVPPRPGQGRRIALIVGGILGGFVALGTALVLVAVFVVVPLWRASSPSYLATAAVERLEKTPALRYRGTFVEGYGRPAEIDLRIDEDLAAGVQTLAGQRADFLVRDGASYLRAGQAYWNAEAPDYAGVYDGRWVLAGTGGLRLPGLPYLEPRGLARTLRQALLGRPHRNRLKKMSESTIRGVEAARITVDDSGAAVYVSMKAPYRLVHVDGTLLTGSSDDWRRYDLDVDELSSADLDALDDRRRELTKVAATALDPAKDETLPAYYDVDKVDSPDADCGPVSCRLVADVRNLRGAALPGTKAQLFGVIRAGKVLDRGVIIGRCATTLPPMAKDKPTRVSCVASDPSWARWWRTATDGWYNYGAVTFNPGWEGTDPTLLRQLFEKGVDDRAVYDSLAEGGALGLATFSRLIAYPGVTPAKARDAVAEAARAAQLPALHAYATSGRVGQPAGLSAFLLGLADDVNQTPPRPGRLWQFAEAVERAEKGKGPVALGPWTAPGTTAPAKADVIDAGREEAVQVRLVESPKSAAAVSTVAKAVIELSAPAGYRQLVRIRIIDAANPLYRLGSDDLRAALKEAGLRRDALGEVDALTVVNDAGTHTFAARDFG
jgi:hypothetical protein